MPSGREDKWAVGNGFSRRKPSLTTDAHLGYPVMAFRSADTFFDFRKGDGSILVASRVRSRAPIRALKMNLPVGRRLDTVRAAPSPTHIAVPARYQVGEFSIDEAQGSSMWSEHGPSAASGFATRIYAQPLGSLPKIGIGPRSAVICWRRSPSSARLRRRLLCFTNFDRQTRPAETNRNLFRVETRQRLPQSLPLPLQ